MLKDKKIVLGVTGGIAVYKACDLVSRLKKKGAQVRVVMTENAMKFVPKLTFATLSGNPVMSDTFQERNELEHISLAKWADAFVVAPATANMIAKLANGIADDLLSTTALAMTAPLIVAPAMNANMWRHPATQANMRIITSRGAHIVGPESGHLACGDDDIGRMSDPEKIAEAIAAVLTPRNDFAGKRVMVTAGPTVERIDPVRFITNRSTGKMGYAIAEAARDRGAEVVLVSGPVSLKAPMGVETVSVESSAQLCENVLSRGDWADVVIQAAAPADFTPETVADKKIKKTGEDMVLRLVSTTDIAAELGKRKHEGQILVAFAAETNDVIDNARAKLVKKNADLVVANDVSRTDAGFGADTNLVTLISRTDARSLPMMSKNDVAHRILDRVLELIGDTSGEA
ncbi:MAG: bifunctional phosphopantothenoylcysteine decarboxylase/phosphopantothenate--cysteine ligase CoaBC [Clostridia bacterium]|nr:bifunctional phosphopantothenoylcysteine decarboxylase/phosphopantothenate--cysteine ligase CoaBC [Clostridia bacterium]